MRKIILSLLFVIALTMGFAPVSYADSPSFTINFSGAEITESDIEKEIIDFVYGEGATAFDDTGLRVDRTAGTEGEKKAGEYLAGRIKAMYGINADADKTADGLFGVISQEITYKAGLMAETMTSNNIIAIQDNITTADYIVVGAHYDNYYGYIDGMFDTEEIKSHGIYDNASGVSALLNLMKIMKDKTLPVDIYYVFFGAEENGNYGSQGFYEGFVKLNADNGGAKMKLMINLDSIGNGDNLYMYADEVKTKHESYFADLNNALKNVYTDYEVIKTAPANKKVNYLVGAGSLGYSHMGLSSDNAQFMGKGNNVINFFSGAWEDSNSTGLIESSNNDNLMHSSDDNLAKVKELYGDVFFKRIKQVTYLVGNALLQPDLIDMLNESSKTSGGYIFFTDTFFANIILVAVLAIAFGVVMLVIKKYKPTAANESLEKLKQAVMDNNIDLILDDGNTESAIEQPAEQEEEEDISFDE